MAKRARFPYKAAHALEAWAAKEITRQLNELDETDEDYVDTYWEIEQDVKHEILDRLSL